VRSVFYRLYVYGFRFGPQQLVEWGAPVCGETPVNRASAPYDIELATAAFQQADRILLAIHTRLRAVGLQMHLDTQMTRHVGQFLVLGTGFKPDRFGFPASVLHIEPNRVAAKEEPTTHHNLKLWLGLISLSRHSIWIAKRGL
jgi:hypothetical protein